MQDTRMGLSHALRTLRRCGVASLATIAAGLAILPVPTKAAVPVQNGSFETVQAGQTSTYFLTVGNNTSVPKWDYEAGVGTAFGCMVINNTFNAACTSEIGAVTAAESPGFSPNGGNFLAIALDLSNDASISQTLSGLVAGTKYNISFYQAAINPETVAAGAEWVVSLGGTQLNPVPVVMTPNTDGNSPWTLQTISFTATAGEVASPTLKFLAESTIASGPPVALLDGVQIPEPASLALLGVGVAGLFGLRRRRTNSRA